MKKILIISLCLILCLVGCSAPSDTSNQNKNSADSGEGLNTQNTNDSKNPNSKKLSKIDFDDLLKEQEMYVERTEYLVQSEELKTLYPDMLQVIIKNDTEFDIKNAVVAFVAWDKNNLPIKIKGSIDFSDGAYIYTVNYNDINLIPGAKYGDDSGFEIDDEIDVDHFEAIVVSYESFDGDTWNNPLYDSWEKAYSGIKYSDSVEFDNIKR